MTVPNTFPSGSIPGRHQFHPDVPFHHTRNPVTHSGRGFRAKFASRKNARMIRCESLLEFDSLFSFEFAGDVVSFDEQPVTIWYRNQGRKRRYTPDFVVRWRDGRQWYVEIKPSKKLATEANQQKFAAIKEHFSAQGDGFLVLTENEIRHPMRLVLVQELLRAYPKNDVSDAVAALSRLEVSSSLTFGQAESVLGSRTDVLSLLAVRHLTCDLTHPMTSDTKLSYFTSGDDYALFI